MSIQTDAPASCNPLVHELPLANLIDFVLHFAKLDKEGENRVRELVASFDEQTSSGEVKKTEMLIACALFLQDFFEVQGGRTDHNLIRRLFGGNYCLCPAEDRLEAAAYAAHTWLTKLRPRGKVAKSNLYRS